MNGSGVENAFKQIQDITLTFYVKWTVISHSYSILASKYRSLIKALFVTVKDHLIVFYANKKKTHFVHSHHHSL